MAVSAIVVHSFTTGGKSISASKTYEADSRVTIDAAVAAASSDVEHALVLDVTQIKAIVINCTQDMTLKFNVAGTPAPEIAMKKDVPYVWSSDSYDSLILTVDVTKVFVSGHATEDGTFQLVAIVDPTTG